TVETIVIDEMESYKDEEFFEIWATWIDGFDDPGNNGAVVGANPALGDFSPESSIVHGGAQSLPFHYDNGAAPLSEATRTFDTPMDWTAHGVQSLVLYFQGTSTNTGGNFYIKVNDTKVAYDGDAGSLMRGGWNKWVILLGDLPGVNLADVRSLTLGVDGGGTGVVYVDDITLTPVGQRDLVVPTEPLGGPVLHLPFDGDYQDASGNGRHGTPMGIPDPPFEAGNQGQAVSFDGIGQYVEITGYLGIVADRTDPDNPVQQPFSVSCWLKTLEDGEMVTWGSRDAAPVGGQYSTFRLNGGSLRAEHGNGNLRGNTTVNDGEWHHAALTVIEGGNLRDGQTTLYVDGRADSTFSGSGNIYNLTAEASVSIGRRASHEDRYFFGSIDEVAIYDRHLSAAEVAWLAGRTAPFDR
ncbi:MAG: LamG domain-containing protein, partial [Planctomycetes bacterium]|nr:LamG domain-containing protein [Planctomycetota bacterium]